VTRKDYLQEISSKVFDNLINLTTNFTNSLLNRLRQFCFKVIEWKLDK